MGGGGSEEALFLVRLCCPNTKNQLKTNSPYSIKTLLITLGSLFREKKTAFLDPLRVEIGSKIIQNVELWTNCVPMFK